MIPLTMKDQIWARIEGLGPGKAFMAKDFLDKNIRCNCISPARVHTPFVDGYLKRHYPGREAEMLAALAKTQPIGRMARPDEVAGLALYLSSDLASFLTGVDLPFDGGVLNLRG